MKKSISFNGVAHINRDGTITIDEGSCDYKLEIPIERKDSLFLEGKLVEVKIRME